MRRLFALVAAVVLVDTMFYAAITPLLPGYTADLGLSKTEAGVLSASYAAGTLIGTFPGAWFAARAGVRRAVLTGLALMSASGVVFAFAEQIALLDAARFLQGVGGAFSWIGGLAWLVSATPVSRRGELIGSALAAAIFGVLMGPVIGGIATATGPEPVFSSAALLGLALAGWTRLTPAPGPAAFPGWARIRRALTGARVRAGFWFVMLPAVFSGVIWVLVPLRLDELGAGGLAIGAVFLVSALVEGAASPVFGRLSDRRGRIWPIRIGLVAAAVTSTVMPLPETVLLAGAAVVVAGLALGFCWTPAMALLSDAVESEDVDQWLAFALVNLAWAGGQVLGGSGGGGLADRSSDAVTYGVVAALLALTAAVLVGRRGREPARARLAGT